MEFRAIVRDGIIVVNTHGEVPDGTQFVLTRIPAGASKSQREPAKAKRGSASAGKNRKRSRASKAELSLGALKGLWADRPEWTGTSSASIAKSLRKKAMGRLG